MTQIKIKTTLLLACGFALAALPAFAETHTGKHTADDMFKASDTNSDGKLSRSEHAVTSKKMFTDSDTNRDGSVTLVEMTAAHEKMKSEMTTKSDQPGNVAKAAPDEMSPAAMIKLHDKNSDGQLSTAEHTAGCDAMFTKMDSNNDKSLSKEECKAGEKMMKSEY
ncbi:transaldolase/EF-hand domain-containing protein [Lacunisphaera limnophila]|uniref:Transaldolase/EF-hand domain-containing protein n=1 Tax=Lacunisphaera limnophila TaxID=1838286 RepID=A0A1I7PI11_9BACT|nr:EF-hand domain-containing protein [Lacunisphaera limnophila]AOS43263.1 transaldolase/EF-hand domain-containing protein [Lacunisphaera limnophila]